jgi:hypothetical protein
MIVVKEPLEYIKRIAPGSRGKIHIHNLLAGGFLFDRKRVSDCIGARRMSSGS